MGTKQAIQAQRAEILARKMAAGNADDTFTGLDCKAVLDHIKGHKSRIQIHDISVDGFAYMLHYADHDLVSVSVTVGELKWLLNNVVDVNRKLTELFFEKHGRDKGIEEIIG